MAVGLTHSRGVVGVVGTILGASLGQVWIRVRHYLVDTLCRVQAENPRKVDGPVQPGPTSTGPSGWLASVAEMVPSAVASTICKAFRTGRATIAMEASARCPGSPANLA